MAGVDDQCLADTVHIFTIPFRNSLTDKSVGGIIDTLVRTLRIFNVKAIKHKLAI